MLSKEFIEYMFAIDKQAQIKNQKQIEVKAKTPLFYLILKCDNKK